MQSLFTVLLLVGLLFGICRTQPPPPEEKETIDTTCEEVSYRGFETVAAVNQTCQGRCSVPYPERPCFCDPMCLTYGDCCLDYEEVCLGKNQSVDLVIGRESSDLGIDTLPTWVPRQSSNSVRITK
jgi:hypothetical protein